MKAKPFTGAILGALLGLAIGVILQQQGVWPLDRLTVFFLPAIFGLLGLLLLSMGREASATTLILALIVLVPMGVWGALGFGSLDEQGRLDGGCEVQAQSTVPDSTVVTDTSKQSPFQIDPRGGLIWAATSPVVFDDYPWAIWVEIGGVQVTLDSETSQDNDGGSQVNAGDVDNVEDYAAERGIDISELRGVYKVGGDAANTCDGFGFVKLIADPFETLTSQIALAVAIVAIILIIVIMIISRGGQAAAAGATAAVVADVDGDGDVDVADAEQMNEEEDHTSGDDTA